MFDSKYTYLVFDFDGTIADTFSQALYAVNKVADAWGYKALSDTPDLRMKPMRLIIKEHMQLRWYQQWKFANDIIPAFESQLETIELFKDVPNMLFELSKTYTLVLLSSNTEKNIRQILNKYPAINFDEIISASKLFGKHKILKSFMKRRHIANTDMLYIGDEIRDIEACNKAGVDIASVTWGYNSGKALSIYNPRYLISTPSELVQLLQ